MTQTDMQGTYRMPTFESARVRDAMHPGVVSCTPDTTLRAVAQIMARRHIHSVVVHGLNESGDGRDWGVISDVDLLRAAAANDLDVCTAGEIAATELPAVDAEEALSRAAQIMAEHEVTHLMVVEADTDRAAGMLSSLDVAGIVAWGSA